MVLKNKKWYIPLVIGYLVLCQVACGTAGKPSVGEEKQWGYTGDVGPEYWHTLSPDYALAKDGKAQSPINITTGTVVENSGEGVKPEFHYTGIPFKMENNGHTIELVPGADSDYITLNTENYALQQVHFHAGSEHQIDGETFAMEVHLVHKDAQGNLAVVGILIVPGAENEALKEVFAKLPETLTKTEEEMVDLEEIDLTALLGGNASWYCYDGSLTTPPCTEGVKWSVSDQRLELSQGQIDAFTAIYSGNRRPVQNLYERTVYITN